MGWRVADEAFAEQVGPPARAVEVVPVRIGRRRAGCGARWRSPTWSRRWPRAAPRAASTPARSSTRAITAALLQPPRGPHAVRFDAHRRAQPPGSRRAPGSGAASGACSASADLLLPWSEARRPRRRWPRRPAAAAGWCCRRPCDAARRAPPRTRPDAVAYAAQPREARPRPAVRGLGGGRARRRAARRSAGSIATRALRWLRSAGRRRAARGRMARRALPRERWLALVAGARVFVSAARYRGLGPRADGGAGGRHAAGHRADARARTPRCRWRASWRPELVAAERDRRGAGRRAAGRPRAGRARRASATPPRRARAARALPRARRCAAHGGRGGPAAPAPSSSS